MTQRVSEAEMLEVVKSILPGRPDKSATFPELLAIVPEHMRLSPSDRAKSATRPEEVWVQILRNMFAHEHEGLVVIRLDNGSLTLRAVSS